MQFNNRCSLFCATQRSSFSAHRTLSHIFIKKRPLIHTHCLHVFYFLNRVDSNAIVVRSRRHTILKTFKTKVIYFVQFKFIYIGRFAVLFWSLKLTTILFYRLISFFFQFCNTNIKISYGFFSRGLLNPFLLT